MSTPQVISGHALVGAELTPMMVDIVIDNGIITAIEENTRVPPVWICPAFYNAHTHLGDTIAMDYPAPGSLVDLVTPPNGLKHRLLEKTPHSELVAGMRASLAGMIAGGTHGCADFREGGAGGVLALREAARGLPFRPDIFGREGGETECCGLGISSTRDIHDTEHQVRQAKAHGKKIAIHAGERDAEDIDTAIALEPDLLIHMTHATPSQLRACADNNIPITICPRSNWLLSVTSSSHHPPVRKMLDLGCTVLLGTDNVMFVPPDMQSEMAFLHTCYHIDPRQILFAAVQGSTLTGSSFFIRKGSRAAFFTIDVSRSALRFSHDPVASIIKRGTSGSIGDNLFNS